MKDEKDCKNCKKSRFIEDDVYECEAETYDIDSKSCYEPKNDRKD